MEEGDKHSDPASSHNNLHCFNPWCNGGGGINNINVGISVYSPGFQSLV